MQYNYGPPRLCWERPIALYFRLIRRPNVMVIFSNCISDGCQVHKRNIHGHGTIKKKNVTYFPSRVHLCPIPLLASKGEHTPALQRGERVGEWEERFLSVYQLGIGVRDRILDAGKKRVGLVQYYIPSTYSLVALFLSQEYIFNLKNGMPFVI